MDGAERSLVPQRYALGVAAIDLDGLATDERYLGADCVVAQLQLSREAKRLTSRVEGLNIGFL
ncbi:MAG TPA: hypothetical protein VIA18_13385 [Polyangia bacterium]|nr:hypothetical protein [Polyangia bacterium]